MKQTSPLFVPDNPAIPIPPRMPDELKAQLTAHLPKPARDIEPDNVKGWWSLDFSGTRSGVKSEVTKSKIPLRWIAVITQEIDALPEGFNFLDLDAHFVTDKGKSSLHITINPKTVSLG